MQESGTAFFWSVLRGQQTLNVNFLTFSGDRGGARDTGSTHKLKDEQLGTVDCDLGIVANILQRHVPSSNHAKNVIRRNMFVAKNADAVFAVGKMRNGMIEGHGAWACIYHVLQNPHPHLYVFDTNSNSWMQYSEAGSWVPVIPPSPDRFAKSAVIGCRQMSDPARAAFQELFSDK